MPEKVQRTFRVEEGKLKPRSKARWFWEQLQMYDGRDVVITLEPPKRSVKQNSFYWGFIIRPIRLAMLEAGIAVSAKAIHNHYKEKYLDPDVEEKVDPLTGEVAVNLTYTTTNLDTTEFDEYMQRIREDEAIRELNVYLPEPGEDYELLEI